MTHASRFRIGSIFCIVAACLTGTTQAQTPEKQTPKQIFQNYNDSVVKIVTDTGSGTGFFFKNSGLVATCFHVIKDAATIKIAGTNGENWEVESVYFDKVTDAAILKLTQTTKRKVIPIGDTDKLTPGDELSVIGNPLGFLDQTLTTGILSARRNDKGFDVFQTTAAASPGSSGSPVITSFGQVIGFISFNFTEGQSLNMAVSISALVKLSSEPPIPIDTFLALMRSDQPPIVINTLPENPVVEKTGAEAAREVNELFGRWFGETGREILKWSLWQALTTTKKGMLPESFIDDAIVHGKLTRTEIAKCNDFIEPLQKYHLWEDADVDKVSSMLKQLSGFTFEYTKAQANLDIGRLQNKQQYANAVQESSRIRAQMISQLGAIYGYFSQKPWFDYNAFESKICPALVEEAFAPRLLGVIPDPALDDGCHVGWTVGDRIKTGSVILALERTKDAEFTPVANWIEIRNTLMKWPEVTEVTIRYQEAGKVKTLVVKVYRGLNPTA